MNFNKIIEQIAEYGLEGIRESVDIECKLAIGKDGKGGLPNAVWESYSAFANTDGGVIILGVKENTDGSFITYGIEKPAKIRTESERKEEQTPKPEKGKKSKKKFKKKQCERKKVYG